MLVISSEEGEGVSPQMFLILSTIESSILCIFWNFFNPAIFYGNQKNMNGKNTINEIIPVKSQKTTNLEVHKFCIAKEDTRYNH
jgi:hypothetical protein